MVTNCGHSFCASCLSSLRPSSKCPTCRATIQKKAIVKNLMLHQLLPTLAVLFAHIAPPEPLLAVTTHTAGSPPRAPVPESPASPVLLEEPSVSIPVSITSSRQHHSQQLKLEQASAPPPPAVAESEMARLELLEDADVTSSQLKAIVEEYKRVAERKRQVEVELQQSAKRLALGEFSPTSFIPGSEDTPLRASVALPAHSSQSTAGPAHDDGSDYNTDSIAPLAAPVATTTTTVAAAVADGYTTPPPLFPEHGMHQTNNNTSESIVPESPVSPARRTSISPESAKKAAATATGPPPSVQARRRGRQLKLTGKENADPQLPVTPHVEGQETPKPKARKRSASTLSRSDLSVLLESHTVFTSPLRDRRAATTAATTTTTPSSHAAAQVTTTPVAQQPPGHTPISVAKAKPFSVSVRMESEHAGTALRAPSVILHTSLSDRHKRMLTALGDELGARIVDQYEDGVTHVVCEVSPVGISRRTIKYLQGVLAGAWVLRFEWVEHCAREHAWIAEEPYEVIGDTNGRGAPALGRERVRRGQSGILHGMTVVLSESFHPKSPKRTDIQSLLQMSDAVVLEQLPAQELKPNGKTLIVADPAAVLPDALLHTQLPVVSLSWVLDCVSNFTVLPYEDHLIPLE